MDATIDYEPDEKYEWSNTLSSLNTSINLPEVINTTKSIVRKSDCELFRGQGNIRLDSQVLNAASGVAIACASNATNAINAYDHHLLEDHIRKNPEFWKFLFPYEVPTVSYLQGAFEATPVQSEQRRTIVRRREKQVAKPIRNPAKLASIDQSAGESTEAVLKMYEYLRKNYKGRPCSYYHLVLHPQSFTRTVENIYNFSFLVKDNLVSIFIDEELGLPQIRVLKASKEQVSDEEKEHFIDSIDMERWKAMVEALRITRPLIAGN